MLQASIGVKLQSLQSAANATRLALRGRFEWGGNQLRNRLPEFVGNDWLGEVR